MCGRMRWGQQHVAGSCSDVMRRGRRRVLYAPIRSGLGGRLVDEWAELECGPARVEPTSNACLALILKLFLPEVREFIRDTKPKTNTTLVETTKIKLQAENTPLARRRPK